MSEHPALDYDALQQAILKELARQNIEFAEVKIDPFTSTEKIAHILLHTKEGLDPKYVERVRVSNQIKSEGKSIGDMVGYIYTDTDKLSPEDVIKMPLIEFVRRFGFRPVDAQEKKWFAVTGNRIDDISRGAIEAGIIGDDDLSNVVMTD
jgi:hypothetical protein